MTISKDRVKPSPQPDSWKLAEIFTTGIILGGYLAMMTVIFFWAAYRTDFFPVSQFTCVIMSMKFCAVVKTQFTVISTKILYFSSMKGCLRRFVMYNFLSQALASN